MSRWYIKPTTLLPILVALDYFSVALVVPLLHQYYKNAGVSNASQREILSSLYSGSQIIGGIAVGALSDIGVFTPRTVLFISFVGSALSYSLIVLGDFRCLIFSRILVGLVKQTMTVTTAILTTFTNKHSRTEHMGRLNASTSIGFIIGPSFGGFLYKYVDERAPAFVASCLFIINSVLVALFIPNDPDFETYREYKHDHKDNVKDTEEKSTKTSRWAKYSSFMTNLKECFTSKSLGSVIVCLLVHHWVARATSYTNLASYYEELFGIEPYQRGYLTSYQNSFSFLFQSFFLQSSLIAIGGECNAAQIAAMALIVSNLMQHGTPSILSIGLACPMTAISTSMLSVSLASILTQVAPSHSIASVLAALDVLKNVVSVTVPFYRTFLFRLLGSIEMRDGNEQQQQRTIMTGDPSPLLWVKSSVLHWIFVTVLMNTLLPRLHTNVHAPNFALSREEDRDDDPKKEQ